MAAIASVPAYNHFPPPWPSVQSASGQSTLTMVLWNSGLASSNDSWDLSPLLIPSTLTQTTSGMRRINLAAASVYLLVGHIYTL